MTPDVTGDECSKYARIEVLNCGGAEDASSLRCCAVSVGKYRYFEGAQE
jgi:hypothetical protein